MWSWCFTPDYRHIVDAAYNREAKRLPLYEHSIHLSHMERFLGKPFADLIHGDDADLLAFYRHLCAFYQKAGFDSVSWEFLLGPVLPGSGALGAHKPGIIKERRDYDAYPWASLPDLFFERYGRHARAFRQALPEGMKGVGGVGNGVFECVQDIVGYMDLCLISYDDPELYGLLFESIGRTLAVIWERFLKEFGDAFCVCRMGDDLGYKSATLIPPDDIRRHVLPRYREIVACVHRAGKPFLLHSCGNLFEVFDDIIATGIDAKHSNEDVIAPFDEWVYRYGDRIGNFGGIDTDAVCRLGREDMSRYITALLDQCKGHGGIAFSTGNSIPDYVPSENYFTMLDIVRQYRGA